MSNLTKYNYSGNDEIDFILNNSLYAWKWELPENKTITWSTISAPYTGEYKSFYGITQKHHFDTITSALQDYSDVANVKFQQMHHTPIVADLLFYNEINPGHGGIAVANPGDPYATIGLSVYTDADEYQYETVAHEIGHILGLSHTNKKINDQWVKDPIYKNYDELDTVMSYNHELARNYYIKSPTPNKPPICLRAEVVDLGIYDIAAAQYLYGTNTDFNSGDTKYNFDGKPFYKTIWDGGGNDTIDLSNFNLGSALDLNNGRRSSIGFAPFYPNINESTYTGKDAIGIAYGANIENAIGTQGKDTIYGNELNNTIQGEKGDDSLYGGAGNDSIQGGDGNDLLDGGVGADGLAGGNGNDEYYVDNIGDWVFERAGSAVAGLDTIFFNVNTKNNIIYSNIEYFQLVEGCSSIMGGNDLNNIMNGNSLGTWLTGLGGNDLIRGGRGNDLITGGAGDDVFAFTWGDGRDTITLGNIVAGDIDTLLFEGAVKYDQLWFSTGLNKCDLKISIIGTQDSVTVQNFFYERENALDLVKDGWGKTLNTAHVDQLIGAMSSFAPPEYGQATLPQHYFDALESVINTYWV
ncbi:hypothetical protein HNP46_006574 [Pseudomonas nitritireducens]|uniref:Peptidase metallopeptidase domain-containing protein n=1 Tax=Pseudomonas nitroreducens TaxID=46680 RepID=A0A7W7KRJ1_PSENT|nr:calcium-binding protein [Pseudomonas nitritireducens]MBB4867655.1 hypothetical protein [Pseudomonas nitritireducens]